MEKICRPICQDDEPFASFNSKTILIEIMQEGDRMVFHNISDRELKNNIEKELIEKFGLMLIKDIDSPCG